MTDLGVFTSSGGAEYSSTAQRVRYWDLGKVTPGLFVSDIALHISSAKASAISSEENSNDAIYCSSVLLVFTHLKPCIKFLPSKIVYLVRYIFSEISNSHQFE